MDLSDEDAVAQARRGDTTAFQILVERHSRQVFRLAYRMTGNEQDAEDVVQETFLKAYRQLGRFESRASFATWIYRIGVNCSVDRMRARKPDERQRADDGDNLLTAPARDPSQDRLVFSAEVQEKVNSALGQLSALERAAFVLRHFEGLSIQEISRRLGLRTNATKHGIFRAVQKLRRVLAPIV